MCKLVPRTCPVCGYKDNTGRGHIIAVPQDITNTRIVALVDCPVCRSVWEETADRFAPDRIVVIRDMLKAKKAG